MHIPIKVDYAVRALVALAHRQGQGPVHASHVAQTMAIPEPFLNHILHTLSKQGLTTTLRGPMGGHMLAVPPAELKLTRVMDAFDESNALVNCLDDESACTLSECCTQRNVWQSVEDAINAVLERTTIADLMTPSRPVPVEAPRRTAKAAPA